MTQVSCENVCETKVCIDCNNAHCAFSMVFKSVACDVVTLRVTQMCSLKGVV